MGLLERRAVRRLGVGRGGVERLTSAEWFAGLNWDALANRQVRNTKTRISRDIRFL